MLEHLRQMIGEYNFAGQYQQMPTPLGGGLVKAAWFKHYAASELPQQFDRIVQSWDTANKATELSDFSVCTTWGIAGKDLYLVDLLRRRMEYPELKREVRGQYERFKPNVVVIEDKASGTQLIQELIAEGLYAVTRYRPQTDKVMRMHAQTAMIENGFVHVPDTAPWLVPYLHELTIFPHGKHDDQVDSTAIQLDKRFLSGEANWAVVTGSTLFIANHCLVFRPGRRHRPSPTPPAGTTRPLPPTSRPCRRLRRSDGAGSSGRRRPEPADGLDARAGLVAHALPRRAAGKVRRFPRWSWGRCLACTSRAAERLNRPDRRACRAGRSSARADRVRAMVRCRAHGRNRSRSSRSARACA